MMFDVPVLLLGYNRPDLFCKTLNRILQINPKYLFISLDGPSVNNFSDLENCKKVRDIVKSINQPFCNLQLRISEENHGCKIAVKSAIDWFFKEVEFGIILEDDCFPNLSFFPFCEEMLKKYYHEDKISHICGTNFQHGIWRGFGSYYFSKNTHIWGWASWRRAWKDYDISMMHFDSSPHFNNYKRSLPIKLMRDVYEGKIDTWDIQWFYTNILHQRVTIIPNINLVKNIGFGNNATHTFGKVYSYIKSTPTGDLIFPLRHSYPLRINKNADRLISVKVFSIIPKYILLDKLFKVSFIIDKYFSILKIKYISRKLFVKE